MEPLPDNAMTTINANAPAAPRATPVVAGRARRHTSGKPPSVSPIKRLYITQRWSSTRAFTVPASSRIARAAEATTAPRVTMERGRKRSVVISAIAAMNPG